jgi:hypothetical protein
MMTKVFLVALFVLAGCSSEAQPDDILVAKEMCGRHGGFTQIERYEHGVNLVITCTDGTNIDVRLKKRA